MEIKWMIIGIVLVSIIVLIIYLIVRNEKDKEEVIKSLNETDIDDKSKTDEEEDK